MTERPLILSAPMMRAYLDGRKTVTRRLRGLELVNNNPDAWRFFDFNTSLGYPASDGILWAGFLHKESGRPIYFKCPFGKPGDRLWFRETHAVTPHGVFYRADDPQKYVSDGPWRPSIHMKREHSRAVVPILSISVERVQDITEEEAIKEGWSVESCTVLAGGNGKYDPDSGLELAMFLRKRFWFECLWNHLHGPGAWERNDYVWRIEWPRYEGVR